MSFKSQSFGRTTSDHFKAKNFPNVQNPPQPVPSLPAASVQIWI